MEPSRTGRDFVPAARPPMNLDHKEMMLIHLLRCPEIFQAAQSQLGSRHFDPQLETGYLLVWDVLSEFWKLHRQLPGRDVLLTLITQRLDEDPNCLVEEARADLEHFIHAAYGLAAEDLIPKWGLSLLQDFLQEREIGRFRTTLADLGTDIPLELPRMVQDLYRRWQSIEHLQTDTGQSAAPEGYNPTPLNKHTTGSAFLDHMLNGGQANKEVYGLLGPTGGGKAQPLHAAVQTPFGPRKMGDLQVGDVVSDPDGGTSHILGVYPQGTKEVFRITFADGDFVEACGDHLWEVDSRKRGWFGRVVDTHYLRRNLRSPNGQRQLSIRSPAPLFMPDRIVPIPPYTLGLLLGNGAFSSPGVLFSTGEQELVAAVREELPAEHAVRGRGKLGWAVCGATRGMAGSNHYLNSLRALGLKGHKAAGKFVPEIYKYNSIRVRFALLRGLFDTDASVSRDSGKIEYLTASKRLAADVKWLIESLGGICRVRLKWNQEYQRNYYRCAVSVPDSSQMFTLRRKLQLCRVRTKYPVKRVLTSVEPIGEQPVQCIRVSSPSHLYLTDHCVVTHNSMLALQIAIEGAKYQQFVARTESKQPGHWFFFSYELPLEELRVRTISYAAEIHRSVAEEVKNWDADLRRADNPRDYERDIFRVQQAAGAPVLGEWDRFQLVRQWCNQNLWLLDMGESAEHGGGGVAQIAAILDYHQRTLGRKVAGVIVDYVGEMADRYLVANGGDFGQKRHYISSFASEARTGIATPFDCPVWLVHQLAGAVNARGAHQGAGVSDAAECKSFANPLTFCFTIGTEFPGTTCRMFSCVKQRRAPGAAAILVEIDGAFGRVRNAEDRFALDPVSNRVVGKDELGTFAQPDVEQVAALRTRRSRPIVR